MQNIEKSNEFIKNVYALLQLIEDSNIMFLLQVGLYANLNNKATKPIWSL